MSPQGRPEQAHLSAETPVLVWALEVRHPAKPRLTLNGGSLLCSQQTICLCVRPWTWGRDKISHCQEGRSIGIRSAGDRRPYADEVVFLETGRPGRRGAN